MNKKIYEAPEFEVIELNVEAALLTVSNGEAGFNPGDAKPAEPGDYYLKSADNFSSVRFSPCL